MTAIRTVCKFPAFCLPALAAWTGTDDFEPPDLQRNWRGIAVDRGDATGTIDLTALDGRNLLRLNVDGYLDGERFIFDPPDEMIDVCRRRPMVELWVEGSRIYCPLPEWAQPGRLLLLGHAGGKIDDSMTALVSTREPVPDFEDAGLGGADVGFRPGKRWPSPPPASLPTTQEITTPISSAAFSRIAALFEVLSADAADQVAADIEAEIFQGDGFHLWRFGRHGKSWAMTGSPDRGGAE